MQQPSLFPIFTVVSSAFAKVAFFKCSSILSTIICPLFAIWLVILCAFPMLISISELVIYLIKYFDVFVLTFASSVNKAISDFTLLE